MNKTALVTGGAKGIGAEICKALANDGYRIALNYNSSFENADALKKELSPVTHIEIFKADVSVSSEVERMFSEIKKVFGGVDILVNNAGIAQQALFTDITDEMWQKMIGVNLTGAFNCCRRALPYMINKKSGKVINIASMWGEVGASMEVHYSASKAGLIGLTKALAKELAPSGINVNAIAPGLIETSMNSNISVEDLNSFVEEIPLGRMGNANEVAAAILFLASENSDYITGQVLGINGGYVM